MMLNEVFIPELAWPCLAYALRRVGVGNLLSYNWVHNEMPRYLVKCPDIDDLLMGTIIVWARDEMPDREDAIPNYITSDGHIVWRTHQYGYHFAVVEPFEKGKEVWISDMVDTGETEGGLPTFHIRMRDLRIIRYQPNYIIRFPEVVIEQVQQKNK